MIKFLHLVGSVAFFIFGVIQYNDPDWYIWIPLYWLIAIISFLSFKKKNVKILAYLALGIFGVLSVVFLRYLNMDFWSSEEGRESVGLLIGFAWLFITAVSNRSPQNQN